MAQDRIILRGVARELTEEELLSVAGGEEVYTGGDDGGGGGGGGDYGGDYGGGDYGGGGGSYAGITGPQPTQKVSSQDPNGPMDEDKSAADF